MDLTKIHSKRCRMCPKFVKKSARFCGPECARKFYAALKQKRQGLAANARKKLPLHLRSFFARINSKTERDFWNGKQCCRCGDSGKRMHPVLKKPFWQGGKYTEDNTDYYCNDCHSVVYNKE